MNLMVNPTITKFSQKVDGEITELKLGANQEDAYAQIYAKGAESGGGKVENNKSATIDVSAYSAPVEVTPTSGKTSMKKATITLSNIPSGNGTPIYAWTSGTTVIYLNITTASDEEDNIRRIDFEPPTGWHDLASLSEYYSEYSYTKISDTVFQLTDGEETLTFTRDSTQDEVVNVWHYSPNQ